MSSRDVDDPDQVSSVDGLDAARCTTQTLDPAAFHLHVKPRARIRYLIPHGSVLNVGIPMLAVAWPILWIALVTVILIEALLARRRLGLETKVALALSTRANLLSTLVGVPLTWLALLGLEMLAGFAFNALELEGPFWLAIYFPFSAPWIGSTEDPQLVFLAFLFLVLPFCGMSILVEAKVARRRLPDHDPAKVLAWARLSNLVTYLFVVVGSGAYFWYMTRSGV